MLKLKPRSEARLWELLAKPSPASCHLQLDKLGGVMVPQVMVVGASMGAKLGG